MTLDDVVDADEDMEAQGYCGVLAARVEAESDEIRKLRSREGATPGAAPHSPDGRHAATIPEEQVLATHESKTYSQNRQATAR